MSGHRRLLGIVALILGSTPQVPAQGSRVRTLEGATLAAQRDTFVNFVGDERGPTTVSGLPYVLFAERVGERWKVGRTWLDSAGRPQTEGMVLTRERSLLTELDQVRAPRDSASLSITPSGAVGWVVPEGQTSQLLSAPAGRPWMSGLVATLAIAHGRAAVGEEFVIEQYALYSPDPLRPRVDTLTVTAGPAFDVGGRRVETRAIARRNGAATYFEIASGRVIAFRGRAGPAWWWNVRSGAKPLP